MGAWSTATAVRVIGRYRLHGELAAGGMATVHLGRLKGEAGFARTVAIKRLHPQFAKDPDFVAMFVDEARLAARVRHPNVVPTLDVISEGGEIFLVMEYVAGESLSRLLRSLKQKQRLVPPAIATTIIAGVLHGLHAAHEARNEKGEALEIVHRDVSPQNVLVGTDGIGHVLDFGVAKATGKMGTTRDGQVKGKLAYMAPEQFDHGTLNRQSDVYAAAVVLWETLTLQRLFDAETEPALLMKVVEGRVTPPSRVVADLPKGLDEIVLRGLARDPSQRWRTAREFALALEKCGRMAPPSEIGEWVQSIAGEEIARRAQKVSDIERGSLNLRVVAPVETELPESGVRVGEGLSQVSAISLSEPASGLPPERRRGRAVLLAGGFAALLGLSALVFFAFTRSAGVAAGDAPPATATTAGTAQTSLVAVPLEIATAPATGVPPEVSEPLAAAPSPAPRPRPPADRAAAPRPAPPPPPPPAAKPHADCDPPFTRDSQGHKHYKMQCL